MSHLDTTLVLVKNFLLHNTDIEHNKSISMNKYIIAIISRQGLIIRHKKSGNILFQDKTVDSMNTVEINDKYIVHTREHNNIIIYSLQMLEIYRLKCYFDNFCFSLYENRIAFIKENNLVSYVFSVFNIETLETEFEFSITKTDNKNQAENWHILYKKPHIKIWGDNICVSFGTNKCYFYHIPSKKLIRKFQIYEKIIGMVMNSRYIILVGEWQDPTRIHIFNYKTGENFKFWSYLDHTQLDTKLDISEDYIFLTCHRGVSYETEWMEIYDLKTKGIYKQKLGNGHTTGLDISVYKNEILVSTTENKLKLFQIDNTPKKEILLAIYNKEFGNIGENYDIRRYILEYLISPIIEKEGKTIRKQNDFILHLEKYEIPKIEIFYK